MSDDRSAVLNNHYGSGVGLSLAEDILNLFNEILCRDVLVVQLVHHILHLLFVEISVLKKALAPGVVIVVVHDTCFDFQGPS